MFPRAGSQSGSGSVRPAVPLVSDDQFTAITRTRNRNATVMITKDGPLERSETRPSTSATTAATSPATGTQIHGLVSGMRVASTPIV
jgi:hypothetical protein